MEHLGFNRLLLPLQILVGLEMLDTKMGMEMLDIKVGIERLDTMVFVGPAGLDTS